MVNTAKYCFIHLFLDSFAFAGVLGIGEYLPELKIAPEWSPLLSHLSSQEIDASFTNSTSSLWLADQDQLGGPIVEICSNNAFRTPKYVFSSNENKGGMTARSH